MSLSLSLPKVWDDLLSVCVGGYVLHSQVMVAPSITYDARESILVLEIYTSQTCSVAKHGEGSDDAPARMKVAYDGGESGPIDRILGDVGRKGKGVDIGRTKKETPDVFV